MTTDACIRYGLTVPPLQPATIARLTAALPPTANTHNPVDVIGDAREDRYVAAIDAVLDDDGIDSVIVLVTPQTMTNVPEIAAEIAKASAHQRTKPHPKPHICDFDGFCRYAGRRRPSQRSRNTIL